MHGSVSAGRRWAALMLAAALAVLLGGCAELDRNAHAAALAAPAGLKREQVATGQFVLTAFARITRADQALTVYIEGDGLAWLSRSQASTDPTPLAATGLALAAVDPAANVVYLARPCQFTPMELNPGCSEPYWTGKRFAPEVIASMSAAVSHFAAQVPGQRIHLVGYSGGGAVAVLMAARRSDIASIRTVAGNLDSELVNRLHHVSPMPESENPAAFAAQIAKIPQLHFSGADDTVVSPEVADYFIQLTGGRCAQARTVPAMTHSGDWSRVWPALLAQAPACTGQ
ncbi:alpha/beta fold hydrolase [Vogesella sp. LIG4]|uniref:alpha/beta fold hydrolase n=1 Tax=Vogesella sp. LIG4 TaxID=1192162 RepID=UPI00081FE9C1|nr:alpha/beta hydrolase [Vogesella sp. LIG4]SCK24697.1 Alpha/beta hydrolase family protein [Vogesella sp. LIG4]